MKEQCERRERERGRERGGEKKAINDDEEDQRLVSIFPDSDRKGTTTKRVLVTSSCLNVGKR